MRTILIALLTSFAVATPIATSETTPITVKFEYDSDLLATMDGAKTVLRSINKQAKNACSMPNAGSYAPSIDRACVKSLKASAIEKISSEMAAKGKKATYVFAQAETGSAVNTRP